MHPARPRFKQQGAQDPTLISGHCPPSSSVFSSLMSRLVTPCAWESSRGTAELRREDARWGQGMGQGAAGAWRECETAQSELYNCCSATACQPHHAVAVVHCDYELLEEPARLVLRQPSPRRHISEQVTARRVLHR